MASVITTSGGAAILYDPDWSGKIDADFFEPEAWRSRGGLIGAAGGRGTAWFVRDQGRELVLKQYRRGGKVAFLGGRYLWTGLGRTRAVREWRLHHEMVVRGLPVPRPVAARVRRSGIFYRAELVTERIAGAQSLAQRLTRAPLPVERWRAIGDCVRRFHAEAVWHPDLNAQNILLSGDRVYLVDFDKSRFDSAPARLARNLGRLKRSLAKLAVGRPGVQITQDDWAALLRGYSDASPDPDARLGAPARPVMQ